MFLSICDLCSHVRNIVENAAKEFSYSITREHKLLISFSVCLCLCLYLSLSLSLHYETPKLSLKMTARIKTEPCGYNISRVCGVLCVCVVSVCLSV